MAPPIAPVSPRGGKTERGQGGEFDTKEHRQEPQERGERKEHGELALVNWEELQEWEHVDITAVVAKTAISFARGRPVLLSVWTLGLLLAAFAGGVPVNDAAGEAYSLMRQHAEVIDSREVGRSLEELDNLERAYYNAKGWFGACDDPCMKAYDKVQMARSEAARLQSRRDEVLSQARQEVGIWSSIGVQDVRDCFWAAWKSGKDFAARMTMYDAMFMMGGRDETLVTIMFRLFVKYVINLTMGLIGAFCYFVYNVYCLVVSYGANVLSSLAFVLLAAIAGLSVVASFLGIAFGAAAGGALALIQQTAKQQKAIAEERAARSDAGGYGKLQNGRSGISSRPAQQGPRCPV
mmetsp:Transcript_111024/g.313090  ORF Transcript_111024/g.313090 Transcript_111024/m.313090 type:complete len:350 (-) Transcript_111024:120-1169(-)